MPLVDNMHVETIDNMHVETIDNMHVETIDNIYVCSHTAPCIYLHNVRSESNS